MKSWVETEDQTIITLYATHTAQQLAALLGVSRIAVINRITKLRQTGRLVGKKDIRKILFTTDEDATIIETYPNGGTPACRPLLQGKTEGQIKKRAYELGLSRRWAIDRVLPLKSQICTEYQSGVSMWDLQHKYEAKWEDIRGILVSNGVLLRSFAENKRLPYDRTFFETIDSHLKAYWLGYIYADGNVHNDTLQLCSIDREFIDNFKSALKAQHAVRVEGGNKFRIGIKDDKLARDLRRLGVVPRKSLILQFPNTDQVPEVFLSSFMLGYFDGDGSLTAYKPKDGSNWKWNFSIISTYHFCNRYNEILASKCDLFQSALTKYKRIPEKDIWEIHLCGVYIDRLERIRNFLYSGHQDGLRRKRARFEELIKRNPKESYTSRFYGVCWLKTMNCWVAQWGGCKLGYFKCEEAAAHAVDNHLRTSGGDIRYLNFAA